MKQVPEKPLREFAVGFYDGPHATPPESSEGPVFLRIDNITPRGRLDLTELRFISEQDFPRWTRRVQPQEGDVVISYEAALHRYVLIPSGFRGCLGRRLALMRPDRAKAEPRFFLYYFLSPQWRQIAAPAILSGATVDRLSLLQLPNLMVRIPPLPVQRQIASILSAYDDLIENNARRIKLLEDAARLLYEEWFVRLRFPGHEHTTIRNGLPEGWSQVPCDQALVLQRGFDLPVQDREEGDIPVYASTGITGYHSKPMVVVPSVVTGRSGTLGIVTFVPTDFWPLNTTLWVREFRMVGPLYALFLLRGMRLDQYNGGVSVPTLDRKTVHRVPVVVPCKKLLGLFDEYALPIFSQMQTLGQANVKLQRARDLLLPRLMSGEVAV